ncbi:MAG: ATP-dependent zinc metalloprotease FtsH [Firmicutes bacterium]|nr:ATP-dependent zinc metalloprotease FtsH [Bacillota bacterium]
MKIFLSILACALVLTFVFNFGIQTYLLKDMAEIKYNEFMDLLEEDKISKVEIQAGKLVIYPVYEKLTDEDNINTEKLKGSPLYTGRIYDESLKDDLRAHNVEFYSPITESNEILNFFIYWILPIILICVFFSFVMRNVTKGAGGIFGMGKSNAKVYMQKETGVTFDDVAGQDEAKESLVEIVDYLHNPEKYSKIGAKQPKGALLVGPPGTGKTLLARAVAGEANVTFLSISGSDFEEMYVGVGASRVRDLFNTAADNAPCIIFIDEIDAVARKRNSEVGSGSNEQTLNQLLSEMDGFDSSKGIVILAATNRPDVLDKALLRPGRFDRRIIVEKPDLKGREDVLNVHAKDVKMGDDIDFNKIALATSGAVGADLANIINEAALRAVRMGREKVLQEDLLEAVELVFVGKEKKNKILSDEEKRLVAFHEVGHALATALQKNTKPVEKITIIPRTTGALGYVLQVPEDEKHLESKKEMTEQIVICLAGRAAEEVEFDTMTNGASNDIEKATALARNMVTLYGMNEKFDMTALESISDRYLDGRRSLICSDKTAYEIDMEVNKIIVECHKKAKEIISENKEDLERIAEYLITRETITGEEFMEILKNKTIKEEKEENKADGNSDNENSSEDNSENNDKNADKNTSDEVKSSEENNTDDNINNSSKDENDSLE